MICTLLRKPLNGGGRGILHALPCAIMNIDGTRVGTCGGTLGTPLIVSRSKFVYGQAMGLKKFSSDRSLLQGRFPTNVILAGVPVDGVPCFRQVAQ